MRRSRRTSVVWKLTKKAIVIITLIVGLRLVWLTLVRGWSPSGAVVDVEIKGYGATLKELEKWNAERQNLNVPSADNAKAGGVQIESSVDNDYPRDIINTQRRTTNQPVTMVQFTTTSNRPQTSVLKTSLLRPKKLSKGSKDKVQRTKNVSSLGQFKDSDRETNTGNKVPHDTGSTKVSQNLNNGDSNQDAKKINNSNKFVTGNRIVKTHAHFPGANKTIYQSKEVRPGANIRTTRKPNFQQPKQIPIHDVTSEGKCQSTIPWGQSYHAKLSTYDLAKRANHTTDEAGFYSIPIRTADDILKDPGLKPVTVILVPFSHADPGYGMTLEDYYNHKTHNTLNSMVTKLTQYPNMTFQWAETVFLSRWFDDLREKEKEMVKRLIKRGQLEIVLGGWVMPDEASTHYVSVVDQLIEGHQWLIENLGVKPRNAWVNDPFGYSSTMPYLWKSSGMDNMVFLRIDQAVKAELMKLKSLDFKWRPYWKHDNSSDMLSTLMAYTNYWIADVCGPEPEVCNEFGFINLGKNRNVVEVTQSNVAEQSMKLYKQLRITADLYNYNTLYIGLGEDFSFTKEQEWDNLYRNYEKIINYMDTMKHLNMKIKFGTLADYFANVRREQQRKAEAAKDSRERDFPTISGDFFPYTEKKNEYWTGYFTTRPMNKRFSRDIESLVRAADIFNVMAYSLFKYYRVKYTGYAEVATNLRTARRELGMFLHHDGITGTSLPYVIEDFEFRLMKAHRAVNDAFKTVITALLTKGQTQSHTYLQEESVKQDSKSVIRKTVLDTKKDFKIVLANSLSRTRNEMISVYVSSKNFEIQTPSQNRVPYQVTSSPAVEKVNYVRVTFPVALPAFGIEVYHFRPTTAPKPESEVKEEVKDTTVLMSTFSIKNDFMTIEFDSRTGMMIKITDNSGRSTNISARFFVYQASKSGAYIFGPAGPAALFSSGKTSFKVTKGQFMSEVKVTAPGIFHSVTLYSTPGAQGQGIYIRNEIDMAAIGMKEMETVLRFTTDVKNGNHFYTDQNGYQLMGRETNVSRKIEANYYPISTMMLLEDKVKRLTLHSKQPHGVASLGEGQLEVMLDRHTVRDDGRGLGQGYYQNVPVNSEFVLQIEYKNTPREVSEVRYTYPTEDSSLINDLLQNEIFIYNALDSSMLSLSKIHPLKTAQLPCDVAVVGMRNLVKNDLTYNGTSLVLRRRAFECGYQSIGTTCSGQNKLTLRSILPKLKVEISETTLSHLDHIKTLDMDSDIRPDTMELRAFRIQV